jgi:signal transduction histidine kinase/CheY-like chemotaxis protein
MLAFLTDWLFDSSGLTAHGFCLLWEPWLIWTYAISDVGIALAYFSIPLALSVIARRRRDLVFRPVLWLFAAFILLCGTTHWLDVLTLWVPAYGLQALVKATTAAISVFTAIALWRLLPAALALPSPAQYREAHEALLSSQAQLSQSQKMEAVGQLTGGIAHDFNNMLQAIGSSLGLLERRIAQGRIDDLGRYIATMRQAADKAGALTHRLLAFSRRQTLQPSLIEPDRLVKGLKELLDRTLGSGIELQLKLNDGRWNALCDPNQLETALLNLAINSRDAMPEGGTLTIVTADRTLTDVDLREPDEAIPGDYVEIVVRDTGTGIDAKTLPHVFEPFFTTKPSGQGTGLGLSQVYGFVKQSGGFVRIESPAGGGTAVSLYLPGREKVAEELAIETTPAPVKDQLLAQPTKGVVLLVEDQTDVRVQIAEAISELGCVVIEAEDGDAGLRMMRTCQSLDLLISDVGLPGLNGRQLAEAALDLNPDLPVLLITGYAGNALDNLQQRPGVEIMRKPFSLDELTDRVRTLLVQTSSARHLSRDGHVPQV